MGILNVTPDSFSDGGLYLDPELAIQHGVEMARQGANWIDVGGESTRPGSQPVPVSEELGRVLPVIRGLRRRLRELPISIDTTKPEVAEEAVRAGAGILNDISGLRFNPRLAEIARRYDTPLILMHLRGTPATMQRKPFARSIWRSLREGLAESIRWAQAHGVRRSQLIIDPGLGFGKSYGQNFEILAHLERLRSFRLPIMVGASRKSFVRAVASGEGLRPRTRPARPAAQHRARMSKVGAGFAGAQGPGEAARPGATAHLDFGDAAAMVISILGGAHIVRVHDVAAAVSAARIADAVLEASG
jgi:dihydropteroate synthase